MSATELKEIEKKSGSQPSKTSDQEEEERRDVETDDPEVQFIQLNHSNVKVDIGPPKIDFTGLTKDELMQFANDPFWRKVRLILFILFWVLWVAMLVAAVIIIVVTPKCPTIPKQTFWQKTPGYLLDVAKFKDSDGDGVGDLKGVNEKLDYVTKKAGFVVLQSILAGSLGDGKVRSAAITDFKAVDKKIGTLQDIKNLLKNCRKKNMKAVIQFYTTTGLKHPWFQKAKAGDTAYQKYYYWTDKPFTTSLVDRSGERVWKQITSKPSYYFSSLHKSAAALNVGNDMVRKELKDAVQFWLDLGFDGIFIDNAAFLAPEMKAQPVGSGLPGMTAKTGAAAWYATGHNGQLYTPGSYQFIQEVRAWVDAVKEKSDRERLFLVSRGNTGIRQDLNKTLAYLGNSTAPGAHSVILFDLLANQGAKASKSTGPAAPQPLRERITAALKREEGKVTFVSQAPSGPRSTNPTETFLNLLLPGSHLAVYGEEIGMQSYGAKFKETGPTSNVPDWYLTNPAATAGLVNDVIDRYNIPMQWTFDGGFTSNKTYVKMTFPNSNVMSMSTLGRGTTRYNIFEELVKLRKEPSMNWGKIEWMESNESAAPKHFIFSRAAKGFPKYVVILIEATSRTGGLTRDLSKACARSKMKLSFPSNAEFKNIEKLEMKNIFFKFHNKGSIFVFQCI